MSQQGAGFENKARPHRPNAPPARADAFGWMWMVRAQGKGGEADEPVDMFQVVLLRGW